MSDIYERINKAKEKSFGTTFNSTSTPKSSPAPAQSISDRINVAKEKSIGTSFSGVPVFKPASVTMKTNPAVDKYSALKDNSDFKKFSAKGASIKNPTKKEVEGGLFGFGNKYDEIGNIVTYSRDNWEAIQADELNAKSSVTKSGDFMQAALTKPVVGKSLYRYMNEDEVDIYNYLLAKEGNKSAGEYLESLTEQLNQRSGQAQGKAIKSMGDEGVAGKVLETAVTGAHSLHAGVDQFKSGISQPVGGKVRPISETQFAAQELQEDMGVVGKTLYSVGSTVGNQLVPALTGLLPGGRYISGALMGLSAAGNTYNDAMRTAEEEGYTREQAMTYAGLVGASEAALNVLLGGVGKATGFTEEKLLAKVAGLDKAFARLAATGAVRIGGEEVEEIAQLWIEPALKKLILKTEFEAPTWQEHVETAIVTALATGIMEGSSIAGAEIDYNRFGEMVLENHSENAIIGEALANAKKGSAAHRLALQLEDQIEQGMKPSASDIGRLHTLTQSEINPVVGEATNEATTAAADTTTEKKKAPFATKAETERLLNQTKSEDKATADYATAQLAHEGETVVSPIAQTLIDNGMKPADAVEQAALIMKVQSGQKLTKSENAKLNLAHESVRTAFTEATGVEVTDGQARNASQRRKVIHSAEELAALKAKNEAAAKAQEEATATAQAEAEVVQQVEQQQAQAAHRAQAETMAAVMLEDALSREAEGTIEYEDGSTQTQAEFVEAYRTQYPRVSEEEAIQTFQQYKQFNSMGQKVPGSALTVKSAKDTNVPGKKKAGKSSRRSSVGEAKTDVTVDAEGRTEAGRAAERELTLRELNRIAGKYGVTVEVQDPDGVNLNENENGFYDHSEKKIILNSKKASNQYMMTYYFVHELTHGGQAVDADTQSGLTSDIIGAMEKIYGKEAVDKLIADTRAQYEAHFKKSGKDLSVLDTPNYIEDEVAANFLMKAISNRSLLDTLAGVTVKPHQALIRNVKAFLSGKKDADVGVKEAKRLIERMQTSLETAQKQGLKNLEDSSTIDPNKREVKRSVEDSTDYQRRQDSGRTGIERHRAGHSELDAGRRHSGRGDLGGTSKLLIPEQTRRIMNNKGIPDVGLTETDDRSAFSVALDAAKAANPNGGMVDSQTVEGLTESGARTFMRPDGNAGVAVEADGNIVGVFKNPALADRGAVTDLVLTAIAQGGNHLDCYATYGRNDLRHKYMALGFEPVAWLEFNREYAPDDWNYEAWGEPDVVMWVHNGDTAEQIVNRKEPYRVWTKDDIHGLPKFEDYDEAKAHQKAELEKRKAAQSAGKRLSIDGGEYAPTYYSQMERVVKGMKQAKFGASSVVSMLRGRGVKAEEIKWSGVEQWLEGKKSVTKDELLEFIAGSELQIEEYELRQDAESGFEYMSQETGELGDMDYFYERAYEIAEEMGYDPEDVRFDGYEESGIFYVADRSAEDGYVELLSVEKTEVDDDTRWGQYKLDGGSNYRELQFYLPDSDYTNLAMQAHWGSNAEGVLAHARMQDFETDDGKMLFIEEIQSDWHNAGHRDGYADKNYDVNKAIADVDRRRDELYQKINKEPNLVAVRDRLVPGIIETNRSFGQDINEDTAREYAGNMIMSSFYPAEVEHKGNITLSLAEKQAIDDILEELRQLTLERIDARTKAEEMKRRAPEAPFSNTYHEYVLKRLLRMAAEEGYDSIGWTTAQQQVDRWSEDYAEGYRIEYDQDIPKFLNKYGKQWGAKVGQIALPGSDYAMLKDEIRQGEEDIAEWEAELAEAETDSQREFIQSQIDYIRNEIKSLQAGGKVWSMPITDAMRQSVLYEGQPRYSIDDEDSSYQKLTPQQQEYFKDSKIRDPFGRLKRMYHGTSSAGFTVFDIAGSNFGLFGQGAYFTDDPNVAESYQKKGRGETPGTYEVYLNITNPLDMDAPIDYDMWFQMLDHALLDTSILEDAEKLETNEDGFCALLRGFEDYGTMDWEVGENVEWLLRNFGFDGIVHVGGGRYGAKDGTKHVVAIAFDQEQIKRIDNTAPTTDPDIRYSIDMSDMDEETKGIVRRLKTEAIGAKYVPGRNASMTPERFKSVYRDSAAKGSADYAKQYIAWVNPADFVYATTPDYDAVERIREEAGELDLERLQNYDMPIWLSVNMETGEIVGHEGRHRMSALEKAGVRKVAIVIKAMNTDNSQSKPIGMMRLTGQSFREFNAGPERRGTNFYLHDALPLSERYGKTAYQLFCTPEKEGNIRYSIDPVTGYEQGSVEDKVLKLLKAGTTEDAISMLEQWVADIEAGKVDADTVESSLKDAYFKAQPLTPQQRADNRKKLDDLVKKYGAIKPGAVQRDKNGNVVSHQVIIPNRVRDTKGVSDFARTLAEDKKTPEWFRDEIERAIADEMSGYTYDIATDKAAMQYVKGRKQVSFEHNLRLWENVVELGNTRLGTGGITKNDIALGEYLYTEAVKAGDVDLATKLAAELATVGTAAGQVVQAMSLLKKMTPSGKLYYLSRTIERLNNQYQKKIDAGKMSKIKYDKDLAAAVLNAKTAEEAQDAMTALLQDVANQIPPTLAERWNAWRYLSMLGNPRTHIRNILSNVVFAPVTWLKDVVDSVLFQPFVKRENRTKHLGEALSSAIYGLTFTGVKLDKYVRFADADYKTMKDVLSGGGKYNPADLIREMRPVFKAKAMDAVAKGNSKALDAEDKLFLREHYVRALSQYLAAQKADVASLSSTPEGRNQLAKARAWAVQEAKKATFRDASALANALSRLERSGVAGQIIVGGVMPFKKTPINILKRGAEYSPLGIVNTVKEMTKGKENAAKTLDSLAATLTGSGLIALGVYLAKEGLLRASGSDDEKDREFEELQGAQTYSLTLDDGTSYTIDWMAPAALPLFVGAKAHEVFSKNGELTFSDYADVLMLIAEPMFQLSMLDGLNNTLTSAGYSDNPVSAVAASMLTSYFGQAIPTLLGQVARTVDDTRRSTYIDKNKDTIDTLDRTVQYNMTKVPGASKMLAPKLDAWGRSDTENNAWLRAFENFISPGYVSTMKTSAMEEELERLYGTTGDNGVLPKSVSKYFTVDKVRRDLTADEWTTYQTEAGQGAYEMLTRLVNSASYKSLSDAQRAKAVKDVFTYADEKAKEAAVSDYATDESWIAKADKLAGSGLSVEDYIVQSVLSDETSGQNTKDVLGMEWLGDEDKALLVSSAYAKGIVDDNTFTDPNRNGYEYTMTATQVEQYEAHFEELWMSEYNKLISGRKYTMANLDERADMVDALKSDVADDTKKWMARQLKQSGTRSTKKD